MIREVPSTTYIHEMVNRYICEDCGMALTIKGLKYHEEWHKKMEANK